MAQVASALRERMGVAGHGRDLVEVHARQHREVQLRRDLDLAEDQPLADLVHEVVHGLADATDDGVLERHDGPADRGLLDRIERRSDRRGRDELGVHGTRFGGLAGCLLAQRAGRTEVGGGHGRRSGWGGGSVGRRR